MPDKKVALYDNLQRFIENFQDLKPAKPLPLHERLANFLTLAKPLVIQEQVNNEARPRHVLKFENLKRAIGGLRPALAGYRKSGFALNPWSLSGIRLDEVKNTAVLAEFMRYTSCGDLAISFLTELFARLELGPFRLPSESELRDGYSVSCEVCPIGEQSERIDIILEGRHFLIGIEVKINASEGQLQLERYVPALQKRASFRQKRDFALIFLTRKGVATNQQVIGATWRDIAAAARAAASKREDHAQTNRYLLAAFAQHIETF